MCVQISAASCQTSSTLIEKFFASPGIRFIDPGFSVRGPENAAGLAYPDHGSMQRYGAPGFVQMPRCGMLSKSILRAGELPFAGPNRSERLFRRQEDQRVILEKLDPPARACGL